MTTTGIVAAPQPVAPRGNAGAMLLTAEYRLDAFLSRPAAFTIAGIAILGFQVALILAHQPWTDEWQALLLAHQSASFSELLSHLHYEGHPPLWYLLLRGLAAVLPLNWVLPAAALTLALPTQVLLLARAPCSRLTRLCLAASYFVLFEYLTISRSFTLALALLVLFLVLRHLRWGWLPLALLPLCGFLPGALSACLLILQRRDHGWWWPGMLLWVACGIAAALSVIPAPDMIPAARPLHPLAATIEYMDALAALLLPLHFTDTGLRWDAGWPYQLGAIGGPLFLIFARRILAGDRLHCGLFMGFVALTFLFSLLVYTLYARHLALIGFLLIALIWSAASAGRPVPAAMRAWLAAGAISGSAFGACSLILPFDNGERAARVIKARGLANETWIVHRDLLGPPLFAHAGIAWRPLQGRCTHSFVRWDHEVTIRDSGSLLRYLRAEVRARGRLYMASEVATAAAARFCRADHGGAGRPGRSCMAPDPDWAGRTARRGAVAALREAPEAVAASPD